MKSPILKTIFIFIISSIIAFNTNAQSKRALRQLENKAYKAFNERAYASALTQFLHLDSITSDPGNYFNYMIGMCYMSSAEQHKALPHLIRAKHGNETSFVVDYYLGRAYLVHENYAAAERHLKVYIKQLAARNITFVNKENVTGINRIHFEKSMNDVVALIALCVNAEANRYSNVVNK
ncbi:MAG: hypothetical protein RL711_1472 [Bacteroidota bacterium]|jgi:hypothetical protein